MLCSGGGSIILLKMIVTGMTEALMLIITALFCRVMFRYGNKPMVPGENPNPHPDLDPNPNPDPILTRTRWRRCRRQPVLTMTTTRSRARCSSTA